MRMYFFVNGKNVQNVGLRAQLMLLMNSKKMAGFVDNIPTGKSVMIECWGNKTQLLDFHKDIKRIVPKNATILQAFFDDTKMPSTKQETRKLMYFHLEQLDKFIGVGKELSKEIREMGKRLDIGFEKVVTAVKS